MFTFINTQKSDSKPSIGMIHDSLGDWKKRDEWIHRGLIEHPLSFFRCYWKVIPAFWLSHQVNRSEAITLRWDVILFSSVSVGNEAGALMLIRTRFCPLYSPPRRSEGARTNLHFHPPGFERTAQTSPIKPVTLMTAERFSARCGPADWKLDYVKREAEPVSIR